MEGAKTVYRSKGPCLLEGWVYQSPGLVVRPQERTLQQWVRINWKAECNVVGNACGQEIRLLGCRDVGDVL